MKRLLSRLADEITWNGLGIAVLLVVFIYMVKSSPGCTMALNIKDSVENNFKTPPK